MKIMRAALAVALGMGTVGCSATADHKSSTSPPSSSPPAKADGMTSYERSVLDAYIACNGDASIKLAIQPEPAQTLALAAAAECEHQENRLRQIAVKTLGVSDGNAFAEDQARKNIGFNISVILKTRNEIRNRSKPTETPKARGPLNL